MPMKQEAAINETKTASSAASLWGHSQTTLTARGVHEMSTLLNQSYFKVENYLSLQTRNFPNIHDI